MFSTISLLVLACAITINAQSMCSESSIGIVPTPGVVKLQPITLEPQRRDWQISIPTATECQAGVSGLTANVCDSDSVPTSFFTDFNTLKVQRTGNLQGYGTVLIIVYCNPWSR